MHVARVSQGGCARGHNCRDLCCIAVRRCVIVRETGFSILVGLSGEMMALERADGLLQCVKVHRYPVLPVS